MADIEREKTPTFARFNRHTIFWPERKDCSKKKTKMRYSSIVFNHISVDTSSTMAGIHIGPLYQSVSRNEVFFP